MKKVINVLGKNKIEVLSRFSENTKFPCVILAPIDEETEKRIDAAIKYGGSIKLDKNHIITKNEIYTYGDIDLNSKADLEYLKKFKKIILNPYTMCTFIPTSFDYKSGTYITTDGIAKGSPFQFDYLKWFKWKYCLIGKPKKIIIYNSRTL